LPYFAFHNLPPIDNENCMRSKSSTYYLMAISVADTLVLLLIVIIELTLKYNMEEPFWSREPWCSLRDIFNYGAYNASTWLVVTFTIERFIAINCFSLKVRICTPRCAAIVIMVVCVFSHLFAVPYYWTNISLFNVTKYPTIYICVYKQDLSDYYVHGLVWFQTCLVYIIPFIIIFTLNGLTLRQIILSDKVHTEVSIFQRGPRQFNSQKRKSVILLITVSMTFALLSVTRFVTQILIRTMHYEINRNDYNKPVNVAADLGTMLDLTNAAINMFLYACTQSRFRKELVACIKLVISPFNSVAYNSKKIYVKHSIQLLVIKLEYHDKVNLFQ
uniref:G-protein coupled receptors family 1 profile domain-containing protein n=1 Tax=Erpetoichthys calabaricus TaxID=27687 RepID=A0A8C4RZI0_ERPCA